MKIRTQADSVDNSQIESTVSNDATPRIVAARSWLLVGVALVILFLLPTVIRNEYLMHNLVLILIYVSLTVAWNMPVFGGQLNFGNAAFFGIGAYTSTLLFLRFDLSPWLGMLGALTAGAAAGALLAVPLLRLRGPFFALSTMAFLSIVLRLAIYAKGLTGGSEGLTIPYKTGWAYLSFDSRAPYYYIALAIALITFTISVLVRRSRMGYHLRAAAIDTEAAQVLGVGSGRLQVAVLMMSAAITSVVGVLYAQYVFVIDPDTVFSFGLFSIQPALNGIIGGMGTLAGPVLGTLVMTPLGEYLRGALAGGVQGLSFLIYGLILFAIVRLLPGGMVDGIQHLYSFFTKRGATTGRSNDTESERTDTNVHTEHPAKREMQS